MVIARQTCPKYTKTKYMTELTTLKIHSSLESTSLTTPPPLPPAPPKSFSKEDLSNYIPHLFSGVEDRNADVRKAASEAVLPFMLHLGYDGLLKHTSRVKVGGEGGRLGST